ncbi:hypothetical protein AB8B22_02675 [Leptotrichia sp. HSP-334]|uniref:Uncharacterized protein n=1 Tax=Leptotrichia rugosa TaxID=3239302 RepID=A0AB39VJ81_9FUSO
MTKPSKSVSRRLPYNTTSSTTEVTSHTRNVEKISQTAGNAAKNLNTGEQTAKSMIEQVYAVRIPAGTVIYEGPVAPQGGMYLGGMETNQIFLPDTRIPGIEFFKYSK